MNLKGIAVTNYWENMVGYICLWATIIVIIVFCSYKTWDIKTNGVDVELKYWFMEISEGPTNEVWLENPEIIKESVYDYAVKSYSPYIIINDNQIDLLAILIILFHISCFLLPRGFKSKNYNSDDLHEVRKFIDLSRTLYMILFIAMNIWFSFLCIYSGSTYVDPTMDGISFFFVNVISIVGLLISKRIENNKSNYTGSGIMIALKGYAWVLLPYITFLFIVTWL